MQHSILSPTEMRLHRTNLSQSHFSLYRRHNIKHRASILSGSNSSGSYCALTACTAEGQVPHTPKGQRNICWVDLSDSRHLVLLLKYRRWWYCLLSVDLGWILDCTFLMEVIMFLLFSQTKKQFQSTEIIVKKKPTKEAI